MGLCECVISSSIKSRQFITKRGGGGGGEGGYDVDTMSVCVCGCEKEVLQDKRKREREEVKINQHHIMQRMYTKKWCGLKKESGMIRKIRKKGQTEEEDEDEDEA